MKGKVKGSANVALRVRLDSEHRMELEEHLKRAMVEFRQVFPDADIRFEQVDSYAVEPDGSEVRSTHSSGDSKEPLETDLMQAVAKGQTVSIITKGPQVLRTARPTRKGRP